MTVETNEPTQRKKSSTKNPEKQKKTRTKEVVKSITKPSRIRPSKTRSYLKKNVGHKFLIGKSCVRFINGTLEKYMFTVKVKKCSDMMKREGQTEVGERLLQRFM